MTAPLIGLMVNDRNDRELLTIFLGKIGYRIQSFDGGLAELESFSGELILTDEPNAKQHGKALFAFRDSQLPISLPIIVLVSSHTATAPWLRAGFNDVLRMPVAKEELALRLEIHLRLRQYSKDARKESEKFTVATLDSLSDHICLLDFNGNIIFVNQAWRMFAMENGAGSETQWTGVNYFSVCEHAAAHGSQDGLVFMQGMEGVIEGNRKDFTFEYSCDSPTEKRWFVAHVSPFEWRNQTVLVISHRNISATRVAENQLYRVAHFDKVTDLPNRAYFYDCLARSLALAKRKNWILGLMFIDLDHFKMINDTMGHAIGDEVLREVSRRLSSCLRESDLVGRLGGDEFCAYLQGLTQGSDAALIAEKILVALSTPLYLEGKEIFVTASIGVTLYPDDGADINALLNAADTAMYWAKTLGRANYQYFTPKMNEAALERANIAYALHHALDRNELFLVYQPQINLQSGQIAGCEALMRWRHPERGLISPATFIKIAEETGLILSMGEWALRTACAQNKKWQEAGLPPIPVAVNLSARHFKHHALEKTVVKVLNLTGLEGKYLELELTENMVMDDVDRIILAIQILKEKGVRFSIDDFGTGYSNLGYLKRFPLSTIKIDKSFIDDLGQDHETTGSEIADMIIALGHNMKLEVVAEGVETLEQLTYLKKAGCDLVQGYFFSRPIDSEEFARMLGDPTFFGSRYSAAAAT